MTATTHQPGPTQVTAYRDVVPQGRPGIAWNRLILLELRKIVDTRSGRWLLIAIGLITAAALTVAVAVADSGGSMLSWMSLLQVTSIVQLMLFPVLGILATTAEFSQRTGLVTFTTEPRRSRVVLAKIVAASLWALAGLVVAVLLAALAHVAAVQFRGAAWDWHFDPAMSGGLVLTQLLGVAQGLGFGLLLTSPAAAIVVFFVLPTVFGMLGGMVSSFDKIAPWLDPARSTSPLSEGTMAGSDWAHLAVSHSVWVLLPLVVGTWLLTRREIN